MIADSMQWRPPRVDLAIQCMLDMELTADRTVCG